MINKRGEGKITTDYGLKDYYKYYLKDNNNPVNNKQFHKVISEFNKKIVDMIINDNLEFTPTTLQLTFCIRKSKRIPRIENNKLINTNPIDWKSTNKLWEEDTEAKEKKIIIRYLNNHTSKYVFRIKLLKSGKPYNNRKMYRFKPCRGFQRNLAKRILDVNQDNFEAFELY